MKDLYTLRADGRCQRCGWLGAHDPHVDHGAVAFSPLRDTPTDWRNDPAVNAAYLDLVQDPSLSVLQIIGSVGEKITALTDAVAKAAASCRPPAK